mgnify:CR=1 FL=1
MLLSLGWSLFGLVLLGVDHALAVCAHLHLCGLSADRRQKAYSLASIGKVVIWT